jgi:methionyl-tRNA formyltransferase
VDLPLVVTHEDASGENIWFESVARLCDRAGIEWITAASPADPALAARLRALSPEYIFSFYYRHMLPAPVLQSARRGAFNMHGSLLPKYRGRAPVNWAVLHGERETGATLHEMVAKPDAGAIIDQQAVPILPNDTAFDVFAKVTVAAEMVLDRSLRNLAAGSIIMTQQDLSAGSYFGGRTAEDGRIDWAKDAWSVHNLVRAVAPPYPGAFAFAGSRRLHVLRTWFRGLHDATRGSPAVLLDAGSVWIRCADGGLLRLLEGEIDGVPITAQNFTSHFSASATALR